jgi:hypothetical protein
MDNEQLLKENAMLKTLLGLSGLPDKERAKRLLMCDLHSLNTQIINFINKSSALEVDLMDLKVSDKSTTGLFIGSKNVPLIPLFSIEPKFIAHTLELCKEDVLFSKIILEQIRLYW